MGLAAQATLPALASCRLLSMRPGRPRSQGGHDSVLGRMRTTRVWRVPSRRNSGVTAEAAKTWWRHHHGAVVASTAPAAPTRRRHHGTHQCIERAAAPWHTLHLCIVRAEAPMWPATSCLHGDEITVRGCHRQHDAASVPVRPPTRRHHHIRLSPPSPRRHHHHGAAIPAHAAPMHPMSPATSRLHGDGITTGRCHHHHDAASVAGAATNATPQPHPVVACTLRPPPPRRNASTAHVAS